MPEDSECTLPDLLQMMRYLAKHTQENKDAVELLQKGFIKLVRFTTGLDITKPLDEQIKQQSAGYARGADLYQTSADAIAGMTQPGTASPSVDEAPSADPPSYEPTHTASSHA